MGGDITDIISMREFKDREALQARVRRDEPFCGPCYDKHGEVNDLQPVRHYTRGVVHYCPRCGEEFK